MTDSDCGIETYRPEVGSLGSKASGPDILINSFSMTTGDSRLLRYSARLPSHHFNPTWHGGKRQFFGDSFEIKSSTGSRTEGPPRFRSRRIRLGPLEVIDRVHRSSGGDGGSWLPGMFCRGAVEADEPSGADPECFEESRYTIIEPPSGVRIVDHAETIHDFTLAFNGCSAFGGLRPRAHLWSSKMIARGFRIAELNGPDEDEVSGNVQPAPFPFPSPTTDSLAVFAYGGDGFRAKDGRFAAGKIMEEFFEGPVECQSSPDVPIREGSGRSSGGSFVAAQAEGQVGHSSNEPSRGSVRRDRPRVTRSVES